MKLKIIFIAALALVSCQSGVKKIEKTQGATQITEYVSSSSKGFQMRPYKVKKLANGLKIFIVEDKSLPRVSLSAYFKVGSLQEKAEQAGLNALTAELAGLYGTTKRNRDELHNELDLRGIDLNISAGYDSTVFSASALSSESDFLIDIFSEIIKTPRFDRVYLESLKKQKISESMQLKDNASAFASTEFNKFLFANTAYGRRVDGSPETLRKIKQSDLVKYFLKYYRPNNAYLALVGNVTEKELNLLEKKFSDWTERINDEPIEVPRAAPLNFKLRFVNKAGLNQAQIRMGHVGVPRNNPDYLKIRVANFVLGGGFVSRLNSRIRDELGLTYGASSGFSYRMYPSLFSIETFTRNDKVQETIKESLQIYDLFYNKGITQKELDSAKTQLKGQFPVAIETVDKYVSQLIVLDYYGVDINYLQNFFDEVDGLKLSDVNAAIKNYFNPSQLRILVYGDKRKIKSQIETFGKTEFID